MSLKQIFLAAKSPQNRENTPVYPAILVRFFAQKSQFFPHALVSGEALRNLSGLVLYLLHRKNVQRFAQAPRGLCRSQGVCANLEVRAVYKG
jgi:hypothetical protein